MKYTPLLRYLSRGLTSLMLCLLIVFFFGTALYHPVQAVPLPQEGSGPDGKLVQGGMSIEWHISGVDVGQHLDSGGWTAKGTVTSTTVRFSGTLHHEMAKGYATNSSMFARAWVPDVDSKEENWSGPLSSADGLVHDLPFDFTLQVPPGSMVKMIAEVKMCNDTGVCEGINVHFDFDPMQAPAPAAVDAAPAVANACTATLMPDGDVTPGRQLYFRANVLDASQNVVVPVQEEWLYNGVGSTNGNMQWDGTAATVDYIYTCPLDQQRYQVTYSIPPYNNGSGWVLTVGALGLGAAAAAAAVAGGGLMATANKTGGKKGPNPPRYILQVDKRSFDICQGETQRLNIQAWRIEPNGGPPVPANNAALQVSLSAGATGLMAAPTTGQGMLTSVFSVVNPRVCEAVTVSVSASAEGLNTSTQVVVNVLPSVELLLQWQDPAHKPEPGGQPVWANATVKQSPPDPNMSADKLCSQIAFALAGPNQNLVRLSPARVNEGVAWVQVAIDAPPAGSVLQPGNPVLTAVFMNGRRRLEKNLEVEVQQNLVLDFWAQGKKLADAVYNEKSDPPGWYFGDLVGYFHTPQDPDKVVVPPFKSNITQPDIQIQPDSILELRNYGESDIAGRYSAEIFLKDGVDLEKYFGPDLTEHNGQIVMDITVMDENGKKYPTSVTWQICPTVELVIAQSNEDGSATADKHNYKENDFDHLQFVADGEDRLVLTAYLRRTDWPADSSQTVPFGALREARLEGKPASEFKLGFSDPDDDKTFMPVPGQAGRWLTRVGSLKPLLYTAERCNNPLYLSITAELENKPPAYRTKNSSFSQTALEARLELAPLYLYLKLWVIPGKQRDTSTVGALSMIVKPDGTPLIAPAYTLNEIGGIERAGSDRSGNRLMNARTGGAVKAQADAMLNAPDGDLFSEPIIFPLEIKVESDGPVIETRPMDKLDTSTLLSNPCPNWLHAWKLWYQGLNWDSVIPENHATFKVLCRIAEADEAVAFSIDVGANLKEMWADFENTRPSLNLNNPEIHGDSYFLQLLSIRREVFGWFYNLRNLIIRPILYGPLPPDDPWEKYLCSALTHRILRYFVPRRQGTKNPETALKMNGIEFLAYGIYLGKETGFHSWAGLYLSGCDRIKDAIYMDPWWNQEWDEEACKYEYGYKRQYVKFLLTAALVASEILTIGRVLYGMVKLRSGLFINQPTLADIILWLKGLVNQLVGWVASVPTIDAFLFSLKINAEWEDLFDGESRYKDNNESRLFEYFKNDLLNKTLPPIHPEKW